MSAVKAAEVLALLFDEPVAIIVDGDGDPLPMRLGHVTKERVLEIVRPIHGDG